MFFQSQAFPTEKNPDIVWHFLNSKKAKGVRKEPEIQNLASKKPNWQPWCEARPDSPLRERGKVY